MGRKLEAAVLFPQSHFHGLQAQGVIHPVTAVRSWPGWEQQAPGWGPERQPLEITDAVSPSRRGRSLCTSQPHLQAGGAQGTAVAGLGLAWGTLKFISLLRLFGPNMAPEPPHFPRITPPPGAAPPLPGLQNPPCPGHWLLWLAAEGIVPPCSAQALPTEPRAAPRCCAASCWLHRGPARSGSHGTHLASADTRTCPKASLVSPRGREKLVPAELCAGPGEPCPGTALQARLPQVCRC